MRNWMWPIDLSGLDSNLKGIEHLSKEEIQKIVAEKFEYFSSLIKYSKNAWLEMKAFKAAAWQEWTFACGLGDEWNKYFQKFMEWKIKFEDIPVEFFEPKYLYYRLPWLLTKENDVLWPIVDHELEHAESSDYGDIIWNSREAVVHWLPVTAVGEFFNAFEDVYMWKKQIKKWRAKRLWVLNLYKDMYQSSWDLNLKSKLKLTQFGLLAIYHWLKSEFPNDFSTNITVDDDVQKEFDDFVSHFDETVDVSIPNKERIKKKNDILWPIIDRLWKKDMDNLKKAKLREQIKQERRQKQKEQLQDTTQKTKDELKDNLWQSSEGQSSEGQSSEGQSSEGQSSEGQSSEGQSSEGQSSEGQSSEGQSSEGQSSKGQSSEGQSSEGQSSEGQYSEGQSSEGQSSKGQSSEGQSSKGQSSEGQSSKGQSSEGQSSKGQSSEGQSSKGQFSEGQSSKGQSSEGQSSKGQSSESGELGSQDGDMTSEFEEEVERRLNEMSKKDIKKLEEQIKKEIDKKNLEEHWKDLQVQKKLLEDKEKWLKDRLKDLFSSKEDKEQKRQEGQSEQAAQKAQDEMQEQWEQIVDAVKKREDDIEEEKKLQEILDEIDKKTKEKDLNNMDELQKQIEDLKTKTDNLDSPDIKEAIKKRMEDIKSYIREQEQKYKNQLKKSWFTLEEEGLYKEYLKIEKEMKKNLDKFIKDLEKWIPKLKEFFLEWWYTSGRVTDMNDAGKKIRLKQFGEKLYSRYEEKESLEINLWICLSIDNSWSMWDNMTDTIKLVVFMWLLCQKRWIPFHVNTFGDHLSIIKDTDDEFDSRKWKLMRELDADGSCTNMWVAVQKDIQVLKEVKKTHPNTVFLPIFITDWEANEWITDEWLIELMKWFKWLSVVAGIWIDENYLKKWYPDSTVIWMDNSSQIMTKLLNALKKFFNKNKSKIFKVTSE